MRLWMKGGREGYQLSDAKPLSQPENPLLLHRMKMHSFPVRAQPENPHAAS